MNATTRVVRTSSNVCRRLAAQRPIWQQKGTSLAFSSRTLSAEDVVPFGVKCGVIAAASAAILIASTSMITGPPEKSHLSAAPKLPYGGDIISSGTPVKEPSTGILFPQLCNGFYLVGCGVRVKWGLVKVYAVGTYVDPLAMSAVSKSKNSDVIQQALLDPTYPRTIRIVMNRNLSIDKYTSAIVEALKPRMMGQDLDKLEEFKTLNPPVDLVQGAEIEMTIRGDTLLYKNAVGGVGTIRSDIFMKALCDTFYGSDPVSPTHKASVMDGIPKL